MKREESKQPADVLRCSVIVTTWKRPVLLRETLRSVLGQSYPHVELLVICDGDDPDVRAIACEFQQQSIRWVFHPENRGLPAARNTGVREATGDVVLFLDDDVLASPELIATHMMRHQQVDAERYLAVCSLTSEDRHTPLSSFVNTCLDEAWKRTLDTFAETLQATGVDSIGERVEGKVWFGLNCSIRRDQFLLHGGFNEHLRASDEEMEFGLRLYLAGVEFVFEPGYLLTHKNSKELDRYFCSAWGASGVLDVYRAFELGQKNTQTRHLVSMFHGHFLNRIAARSAWRLTAILGAVAPWLKKAANQMHSHLLFSAWARTAQATEYWSHVKSTGRTRDELKSLSGRPRCALMLHSICDPHTKEESSYYIAPQRFQRFMRYLHTRGYTTASLAEWGKENISENRVLLTFDDGYDDLYEHLFPLVIQHRLTPVIFLVANHIGGSNVWDQANGLRARNLLTLEQVREMQKYGVEFGSHTLTHPWLPSVSDVQLGREVTNSKHRLEDLLGVEISSFAYPYGGVDRRVRSAVARAGYKLAFTTLPGLNWWNDPLCLPRAEVNDWTSTFDFVLKLRAGDGLVPLISRSLRDLEEELPTKALRSAAKILHGTGREAYRIVSRRRAQVENE